MPQEMLVLIVGGDVFALHRIFGDLYIRRSDGHLSFREREEVLCK